MNNDKNYCYDLFYVSYTHINVVKKLRALGHQYHNVAEKNEGGS